MTYKCTWLQSGTDFLCSYVSDMELFVPPNLFIGLQASNSSAANDLHFKSEEIILWGQEKWDK